MCPDTACDLSCGCERLRMRQTESLHVGTKSDGGSWGKSVNMTSELGVSFHSDKKRECKRMVNDHSHTATASSSRSRMPLIRLPRIWNPSRFVAPHRVLLRLSNSTMEQVFAIKVLAENPITSRTYNILFTAPRYEQSL